MLVGVILWVTYLAIEPRPAIFGPDGMLKYLRDFLVMAVPFIFGALATVSMASGEHLDRRPRGAELLLDGRVLTTRQFVCYLLGYLSFLGIVCLIFSVGAELLKPTIVVWTSGLGLVGRLIWTVGVFVLYSIVSAFFITILWALYFLTDIVNRDVA